MQYRDAKGLTQVVLALRQELPQRIDGHDTFRGPVVWRTFIKQAVAGKAYVVLKTKRNPQGEVRGVLKTRRA